MERRHELDKIEQSKLYFSRQIEEDRKFSNDLEYDAAAIEKFAREKYLMKRDNEDLFLIQPLQKK
jgi:cell division protein FtsB